MVNPGAGMVKDPGVTADSEIVRVTNMTTSTVAKITDIEDAANVRWLAKMLEPARTRVRATPTDEAVDRIRARVFGDAAPRKVSPSIAA